ncbi:MAG: amino acid synthesis family protein [Pseudomonadota bacterium]
MSLKLRKLVNYVEETRIEGGRIADPPVVLAAVAAVIANPWAEQGFVEDLRTEILAIGPVLGDIMVPRLLDQVGGGDAVEAYGKAAMVGLNGEIEHASGMIHTLRFGNKYRDAVEGTSYLSFTNTRCGAGSKISVPMMHKHDAGMRSHYLTLEFNIEDAPHPDEIVIVLGAATRGRPDHRIGDRYQDMEEMGLTKNHSHGD